MAHAQPDVSLISSAHDISDARLHREVTALIAAGLSVEVFARGQREHAPAGSMRVVILRGSGLLWRIHAALTLPWRAHGRVLVVIDPDLVPMASVRCRLSRARRLVVDVHEDYQALLSDRRWARGIIGVLARAVARLSTGIAMRADLTLVADDHVPPHRARNRVVVRNLADSSLLPALHEPSTSPRMIYVGDVRTSRGLKAMLAALEHAPSWTLDIVGRVAEADAAWLADWQRTSLAAPRLRLHGQLPPTVAWQHAQTAWVGLVLLQPTPAFLAAMPSKVYEYQACGLAVVTTDLPRQRAWVQDGGIGVVVPNGDDESVGRAVADALREIEVEPHPVHRARAAAAAVRDTHAYAEFANAVSALARD